MRLTLGSSKFLASLQEGMTDLLRDAGNTISEWTNNSDIVSACCVKFSSAPNMQVVEVRTLAVCGARTVTAQDLKQPYWEHTKLPVPQYILLAHLQYVIWGPKDPTDDNQWNSEATSLSRQQCFKLPTLLCRPVLAYSKIYTLAKESNPDSIFHDGGIVASGIIHKGKPPVPRIGQDDSDQ